MKKFFFTLIFHQTGFLTLQLVAGWQQVACWVHRYPDEDGGQ